jgi:hypothetical protein
VRRGAIKFLVLTFIHVGAVAVCRLDLPQIDWIGFQIGDAILSGLVSAGYVAANATGMIEGTLPGRRKR